MRLEQAANPTFAHHQTFHPRFGWVKKGFSAALEDPEVFLAADATVTLGVGKNMVAAIRFWTAAFRVLDRVPAAGNARVNAAKPTPFGLALLDEQHGYDPYFEDLGTLWVLHWHLVSATSDVPVWWSTFNDFTSLEFSEAQLLEFVTDEVLASGWDTPNTNSIAKDVDCLLHMYAPRSARARQGVDDLLDSPFRELALVVAAPGGDGRYRFNRGTKPGLSPELIVYTCLDFIARNEPDTRTATLTHLANDPGTPGRLLKLTENSMHEAFLAVADRYSAISITSPAGAPQLAISRDPESIAADLLHSHFLRRQPNLLRASHQVAGPAARRTTQSTSTTTDQEQRRARTTRASSKAVRV